MTTKLPARRGYFDSGDGLRLYSEHDPIPKPRARLLHVHGFAEHCGRYRAMHARLGEAGFSCHRFDLRGHGNSAGRRGHIYRFEDYVRDFEAFVARVDAIEPGDSPRILLAHSNGGLVVAHALLHDQTRFAGVVLSSPFFGFAVKVPAWKTFLARTLSKYVPAFSLPTDIPPEDVSHDPATIDQYATDPLIGRVATARWLIETEQAQAAALDRAGEIDRPLLIQLAGTDKLAEPAAARAFFDGVGSADKTLEEYPELYHEIWFETDRARVYDALEAWLDARWPADA